MSRFLISVVVGSIRRESLNRKLASAISHFGPPDFTFEQVQIDDLPLYSQDCDDIPAESVRRLKSEIGAAKGLLFVTPEYNRSIPGVLKNALDHASRPYGHNAWAGKPAGILGVSIGASGTSMAQQHLRNILAYLDVPTMAQPEAFIQASEGLFDAEGRIGSGSEEFFKYWMKNYVSWVKRYAG